MNKEIFIRNLEKEDCQIIYDAFQKQGWNKSLEKYEKYLKQQTSGIRQVLIAEYQNEFAGYLTIIWQSSYQPFADKSIPEVVDFNVLIKFRKKGIGSKLMDEAETLIAQKSDLAGIGVGLYSDYGNAQRLYVKRGYIPDGLGIYRNGKHLQPGEKTFVDDGLILYFTKNLK